MANVVKKSIDHQDQTREENGDAKDESELSDARGKAAVLGAVNAKVE